ncbi:hypothetical protein AB0H83_27120 [Dactylosporangium sp. NPDC050688]|uniref:hypothetical protein n=1 Tax=Dactylosporangium sp. NPDC050688 TaxID=3157217 RepID=UPI0033FA6D07
MNPSSPPCSNSSTARPASPPHAAVSRSSGTRPRRRRGPPDAPLLRELAGDPAFAGVKLVAEPWDCAGYALGAFPPGWVEWNDRYRDDLHDYWRGRAGRGALATRLGGSSDVFAGRGAVASLNFRCSGKPPAGLWKPRRTAWWTPVRSSRRPRRSR